MAPDLSWLGVVSSGGSVAVALTVMYFALRYIRERDADAKELMGRIEATAKANREHMDKVRDDFLAEARDGRAQNRQTTETMFSVMRETVKTMTGMADQMVKVGEAITELRGQVANRLPDADAQHRRDEFNERLLVELEHRRGVAK